jgi:hypothetical protein
VGILLANHKWLGMTKNEKDRTDSYSPSFRQEIFYEARPARYCGEESVCSSSITRARVSSISNERRTTPLSLPLISK